MGKFPPFLKRPRMPPPAPPLLLSASVPFGAARALAGNMKHMIRQMTLNAAPTPLQRQEQVQLPADSTQRGEQGLCLSKRMLKQVMLPHYYTNHCKWQRKVHQRTQQN
jgi:hypothetical protein